MKLILLTVLFLTFHQATAQMRVTVEGKVIDKSTKGPLAYVSIYKAGSIFGTATNKSGNFMFKYEFTGIGSDTLIFSHLGYQPFQMILKDGTGKYLEISLEPQTFELNEIVVRPLDPIDVVYNCINRIPENYNHNQHFVQGFQREYVKQSEKYIQVLEVVFKTNSTGSNETQFSNVLDARYIEDKEEKAPLWNPSRGGFYTFGWATISGIEYPSRNNFLGVNIRKKSDLKKNYEFQLKESIRLDEKELYVVEFDQRGNVRRPLLKGTLYIDSETLAIVKLECQLSPKGLRYLKSHETWGGKKLSRPPKKIEIRKEKFEITYKKYGSKWYLGTLVMDSEFDASLVYFRIVQSPKRSFTYHSERIVTAIDTTAASSNHTTSNITDVGSISTLQNFIKKNYETYNKADEGWINGNFIQSDTSVAIIAKQLKINNEQWELLKEQQAYEKMVAANNYTSRELTKDLDYLKETLENVHPGLYWYTDKVIMDSEFKAIKNRLQKKNTEAEFFQLLGPLIEKIHCGHTTIRPSLAKSEYQSLYKKRFPIDIWISGDSAFVTKSLDSILKGSKIIAIDVREIREITGRIKKGLASDGFNQTYKCFLLNNEFPFLLTTYFPAKDIFNVKVEDVNGWIRNVEVIGEAEKDVPSKNAVNPNFYIYDSLQTAMLTIPSFSPDQDLPNFFEKAFELIERSNIKNLIIDIRKNGGGRDEYGLLLFSYLAREPFRYYKNISVATSDTVFLNRLYFGDVPFGSAVPDYVSNIREDSGAFFFSTHSGLGLHQPKEHAFKGPVYILINGGTFSTAAEFASITHRSRRAIFIGEETGGGYYGNCSLATPTLTLPNSKIRIIIPLAKYELEVDEKIPAGNGIIPDHLTQYNVKDILNNKDKELEICLKMIVKARD
ncbi:hypothetical protein BH23BAC2_BH23BAC2_03470 [soil metagenome]